MSPRKQVRYNPSADCYRIMGLSPSATPEEIHRVFRQHAKAFHPDAVQAHLKTWATRQFQLLNEAHEILGDPTSRAVYDRQRLLYLEQAFRPAPTKPPPRTEQKAPSYTVRPRQSSVVNELLKYLSWRLAGVGVCLLLSVFVSYLPVITRDPTTLTPAGTATPNLPRWLATLTWPKQRRVCKDPNVQIVEPSDGQVLSELKTVRGTVTNQVFDSYTVMLGTYNFESVFYDVSWQTLLDNVKVPVQNSILIDPAKLPHLAPGIYEIMVRTKLKYSDDTALCEVIVLVKPGS